MWRQVKTWLGLDGDKPAGGDAMDAHVAATALLVEAAMADGIYADIEQARIRAILTNAFRLSEARAAEVLEAGEAAAEAAVDHYRFTKVVKSLPLSERVAMVERLWMVALADGEESPFEDAFVRRIAGLLHVPDTERGEARARARENAASGSLGDVPDN